MVDVAKNPYREADALIIGDAATCSDVGNHLYYLCDTIGTRFAGSDQDKQAAEYIESVFRGYNIPIVYREEFPFTAWERGQASTLHLQLPTPREYPCYALPYGAATPPEGIETGWVDIGDGSDQAVQACGDAMRGKLALTDGTSGHRKEIQRKCAEAGALGVLHGHTLDGMLLRTGSVDDGRESPIAAVGIPYEAMETIRRMGHDTLLKLFTDGKTYPGVTSNIVAEWPGDGSIEELVIMGGHYDSHDISPGAFDNGAGVSIVMEVARLLSSHAGQFKRSVRLIAFGAEEVGLLGSHYHAYSHRGEMAKVRFMLNCDTPCLGRPHGLGFHKCAQGEDWVHQLSKQMGEELIFANRFHSSSDHYPFLLQGVITAGLAGKPGLSRGGGYYHMAADTPDKLEMGELKDTAGFAARVILRAAADRNWPELKHDA